MGKIAMVFSGQGAQYSGMGQELYLSSKKAKEIFDTCDAIRPGTSKQCFEGTKEELMLTINTQPCLFCVDLAAAMAVIENGITPDAVAGFSLGEIAALCVSGAMSVEDGFRLVCKRAALMHKAAVETDSTLMAVLKLPTAKVEELCISHGNVYPVNYNCEGQVVVAGKQEHLDSFAQVVKTEGGRAMPLSVSGGFHSLYMNGAAKSFKEHLDTIRFSNVLIPTYANVSALPYENNVAELLSKQVNHPVLWKNTIENMLKDGYDIFIEVGAGKTLSSLIKKIAPDSLIVNVENKESLEDTLSKLSEVV